MREPHWSEFTFSCKHRSVQRTRQPPPYRNTMLYSAQLSDHGLFSVHGIPSLPGCRKPPGCAIAPLCNTLQTAFEWIKPQAIRGIQLSIRHITVTEYQVKMTEVQVAVWVISIYPVLTPRVHLVNESLSRLPSDQVI